MLLAMPHKYSSRRGERSSRTNHYDDERRSRTHRKNRSEEISESSVDTQSHRHKMKTEYSDDQIEGPRAQPRFKREDNDGHSSNAVSPETKTPVPFNERRRVKTNTSGFARSREEWRGKNTFEKTVARLPGRADRPNRGKHPKINRSQDGKPYMGEWARWCAHCGYLRHSRGHFNHKACREKCFDCGEYAHVGKPCTNKQTRDAYHQRTVFDKCGSTNPKDPEIAENERLWREDKLDGDKFPAFIMREIDPDAMVVDDEDGQSEVQSDVQSNERSDDESGDLSSESESESAPIDWKKKFQKLNKLSDFANENWAESRQPLKNF